MNKERLHLFLSNISNKKYKPYADRIVYVEELKTTKTSTKACCSLRRLF